MDGSTIIWLSLLSTITGCICTPIPRSDWIYIENITFQLYTRKTTNDGVRVSLGDMTGFDAAGFDPSLPTKFLVHGWMDDINSHLFTTLQKEFLALEPMNVFAVAWPSCSKNVLYEQAVECAQLVGIYIGDLVVWLQQTTGLSPANVHGLGHSLGGQAISFASRVVQFARISALDPAAPLFSHVPELYRIDKSDADFVDVYHTSTKVLGFKDPIGHIDFYPNGGQEQPGCGGIVGHCAHSAVYYFYGHTVSLQTRNDYSAFKCDSVAEARNMTCLGEPRAVMGYGASIDTPGIYFMNISSVPYPN